MARMSGLAGPVVAQPARIDPPSPAIQSAPIISVRDLRKSYGALQVVRGLSFSVARGECFGLRGGDGGF